MSDRNTARHYEAVWCDDTDGLPAILDDYAARGCRVRFVIPGWPRLLVIADAWTGDYSYDDSGIDPVATALLESPDFQELAQELGYCRNGARYRSQWCDDAASLSYVLNKHVAQGYRPKFVTSHGSRILAISQVSHDGFIAIPPHLMDDEGEIFTEHPDFHALAVAAGYRRIH